MKIKRLGINGQTIEVKNLTLILGANGTGKTRLLEELFAVSTGRQRKTNFWGDIEIESEVKEEDTKIWEDHLHQRKDNNQKFWFCPYTYGYGEMDGRQLNSNEHNELLNNPTNFFRNRDFLKKELIHYLPVDQRLDVSASAQIKDPSTPPGNKINILWRNREIIKVINFELKRLFNKRLYLAPHKLPNIELRLLDLLDGEDPPAFNYLKQKESYEAYVRWIEEENISDISTEGHGIRAFLHIMFTYSVPTNLVLLIDEPETHLYPSIKRRFGSFIGELAGKKKKQFICVTHDSDFLQGVFDSNCDMSVIKLYKTNRNHSLIHVQYDARKYYMASQKQAQFLQIPLVEAVLLVEGATDRYVYENSLSHLKLLENHEYKVISCGGKDSIVNPQRVAEDLKVPYAVILDADVLKGKKLKHFEKILRLKGEERLFPEIEGFSSKLRGVANFKDRGIDALDSSVKPEFRELLRKLGEIGIFIVPKGEIESWRKLDCSSSDFPEVFVRQFRWRKSLFPELTEFLREVESYLKQKINSR